MGLGEVPYEYYPHFGEGLFDLGQALCPIVDVFGSSAKSVGT